MSSPTLTYWQHIRATATLAWPVIAGQLGHIIIGQFDNLMIGQLGATELAACALANGMFFLVVVFGFGLTSALVPITAEAIGADTVHAKGQAILREGLWITAVMAFVFIGVLLLLIGLLPFLGQSPDVVPLAQSYLGIVSISVVPMLFFLILKHFIEGFGQTKPGMYIMLVMVFLNIFFNWLFIYGTWGFPAMGLDGAAWGTLFSRVLGLLMIVYYLVKTPRFASYVQKSIFFQKNNQIRRQILDIGIPSGLQFLFEVGAFSAAIILAGRIDENAQSAHQIAVSIASFTYMFYMGISAAASIRIGKAYGRGDSAFINKAGFASFMTTLLLVLFFIGAILLLRSPLSYIYIDHPLVSPLIYDLLILAVFFQVFDGIQTVAQGVLRGFQDVKIPAIIAFFAYWILGVPIGWFLSEYLNWGLVGIWLGLTIGLTFGAVALSLRFYSYTRQSSQSTKSIPHKQ